MVAGVNDLVLNIVISAEVASRELKKFNRTLDDTNKKMTKATKLSKMLKDALKMFGIYLGFKGISNFVKTTRELDLMERSITGLTKSTQDWNYIQQEALRTGTRLQDTARGYRNFYASASMAGFGKGQIQGMYSDLLTSTRAIGATPQQTQGALLALEQMISKGVVSMEELRRQLGNALPGAFEIGAKAMNMTTAEFNKFVKTGQLASTVFVPKFIEQLKKEFGGGFESATKSIDFAMINLDTLFKLLQVNVFKGQLSEGLAQFFTALGNLITNPMFVSSLRGVGNILGVILKIVSAILNQSNLLFVLLAPTAIIGIVNGVKALAKAVFGLQLAFAPTYATILAIITALVILQDLIYGLFLRDKGFKSLTGDWIASENNGQFYGATSKNNVANKMKKHKELMDGFNAKQPQMYSAPSGIFEKIENKVMNISLGDINIKGASDPIATAQTVRNELIALFTGAKIKNGVIA